MAESSSNRPDGGENTDALQRHALDQRRRAVRDARIRSMDMASTTRRTSGRDRPSAATWSRTLGSPHGPWDVWALLAAFERQTVFLTPEDDGVAVFRCASCDIEFPIRLWLPPPEAESAQLLPAPASGAASEVPSAPPVAGDEFRQVTEPAGVDGQPVHPTHAGTAVRKGRTVGVDGVTPAVVAERLLLAAVRHHCASAQHSATLRKLWPEASRRGRSPTQDLRLDAEGRSRNHVVVTVNGIRTLVSRQVGGSAAFEPDASGGEWGAPDDVIDVANEADVGMASAWMHQAATVFSTAFFDVQLHRTSQHSATGKANQRASLAKFQPVRLGGEVGVSQTWNPADSTYVGGASSRAGRVVMLETDSAPPTRDDYGLMAWRAPIRAVEMPVGGRDDTCADFAQVADGCRYRIVRTNPALHQQQQQQANNKAPPPQEAAASERPGAAALPAATEEDVGKSRHLEDYLRDQVALVVHQARGHEALVDDL